VVWIVLGIMAVCAVIGLIELRSWRRSVTKPSGDWQKGGHGPWPSGGTDRSTQPGRD
jgi:uncharacterized membrane protein